MECTRRRHDEDVEGRRPDSRGVLRPEAVEEVVERDLVRLLLAPVQVHLGGEGARELGLGALEADDLSVQEEVGRVGLEEVGLRDQALVGVSREDGQPRKDVGWRKKEGKGKGR